MTSISMSNTETKNDEGLKTFENFEDMPLKENLLRGFYHMALKSHLLYRQKESCL